MAIILLVDDETSAGPGLRDTLARTGHEAYSAGSIPQALAVLARGDVDLVIADGRTPSLTGPELQQALRAAGHDIPMLVITEPEQLEAAVDQALELVRLRRENEALRREMTAIHPDGAVVLTTLDVGEAEARLIERALVVANGNRTRAAKLLGISVRTLRNKLNGPGRAAAEAAAD